MDISELYGNLPGTDLSEEIDNVFRQNRIFFKIYNLNFFPA